MWYSSVAVLFFDQKEFEHNTEPALNTLYSIGHQLSDLFTILWVQEFSMQIYPLIGSEVCSPECYKFIKK